jgi:hypothetical protein
VKRIKVIQLLPVILSGFLFIFFCGGCSNNDTDIDETLLTTFHSFADPVKENKVSEEVDCYIDYSDGMGAKVNSALASFKNFANLLSGKEKLTYYRVGSADSLRLIPDINSPDADFKNPKNYTDKLSKLKPAIDSIVKHKGKTSVFITDFEQIYQGRRGEDSPWAQVAFKEWLMSGNRLDIFSTPYIKGKLENWIYILVFTPAPVLANETLYKKSVLKFLEDNLSASNKHFTYSAKDYKIEGETDEAMGNANDNITPVYNLTKTRNRGFEYYEFASGDLLAFLSDESQSDKRVINKLKITPTQHIFSGIEFGLNTYDISKSISDLAAYLNQEAPKIEENEETGDKTVVTKLLKYKYEPGSSAEHVFNPVYNKETHAIGIKLDPGFTGVDATTIYKVDIILKSLEIRDFGEENNVLKINYENASINPLGESLEYAIRNIKNETEGKPVYTVYIRIDK